MIADARGARFLGVGRRYDLQPVIDCTTSALYGPGAARNGQSAAIHRDRAPPSVIAWALGDEEDEVRAAHSLDPTRQVLPSVLP